MLYVVTGGARSGKSSAAERLAQRLGGALVVVATGEVARDVEMTRRIAAHQASRGEQWRVVEPVVASEWRPEIVDGTVSVLECLGTLAGRIMDETARDLEIAEPWELPLLPVDLAREAERRLDAVVDACIGAASGRAEAHLIVVTNEVGDGVVPQFASGRLFRDVLGRENRRLVEAADGAWLVVSGRCIDLTALPTELLPRMET